MHYLFFLICHFWFSVASASEDFALYTGLKTMDVSKKEIKKILIGQQTYWENGEDVVILLYPKTSPQMTYLCDEIIGIPEATYRRFIIEKAFRSGLKLVEIESYNNVAETLLEYPGAIFIFDKTQKITLEEDNNSEIPLYPITISK